MAITYKVVFENHGEEYKIAGVAANRGEMNKIASVVSSKGSDYSALSIDYMCNTPLNDELFVVYTRAVNDVDNDVDTFYEMILSGSVPSDKDVFLYKIEKSATERVSKINAAIEEAGQNDRKAVMVTINLNTLYNVAKPKVEEEDAKEEVVEEPSEDDPVAEE